jgi:hypothetical protein
MHQVTKPPTEASYMIVSFDFVTDPRTSCVCTLRLNCNMLWVGIGTGRDQKAERGRRKASKPHLQPLVLPTSQDRQNSLRRG